MGKHELKMKMVREGETLPLNDGYDPMADLKAHSSSLKVSFQLFFLQSTVKDEIIGCADTSSGFQTC